MVSADSDAQTTCPGPVAPDPPANVLVLAPTMEGAAEGVCADLLSGGDPATENVLLVTMLQSPDQRLDVLRRHDGDFPAKVAVVGVGDGMRSAASAHGGNETASVPGGSVRTAVVSEPSDLTGIGIKVGQALSAWEDDGNRTTVCFHSITSLLQYADLRRVFRFLHVITKRVSAADGIAHFHMDPTAHDSRTVATVRSLFDTVIEYEDGTWTSSTG